MRLTLVALAAALAAAPAAAAVAPPVVAPDLRIAVQGQQGQGQAKKANADKTGKQVAKGKDKAEQESKNAGKGQDKAKNNASAERSNKGGETKGKARADEVKGLNQQKKAGGG